MVSKQTQTTVSALRAVRSVIPYIPLQAQRLFMRGVLRNAEPPRKVTIEPLLLGKVPGELITPDGIESDRVLYYLHGGGYCLGSLATHRKFVAALAKRLGMRALHIDYRLAPEHPHPAALEDALAGYDWLLHGAKPENIVMGGESAGGGLTIATLLSLRDTRMPLPSQAILLSPWLDLTCAGESLKRLKRADPMLPAGLIPKLAKHYYGKHAASHPLVSPLFADLRGLPPMLVHVGDREVLLDDSVRFAARCKEAGVPVTLKVFPELFHAFHLFGHLPEARAAVNEVAEFVNGVTPASC